MAADLVLVDTSAWIEYLNRSDNPTGTSLRGLLRQGRAGTTGLVLGELLQGTRNEREKDVVETLIGTTVQMEATTDTWRRAGRLASDLRRQGQTVALLDCLLAAVAMEYGAALLSLDRHFRIISRHVPLKMFPA